jgi:hypothetical protein
MVHGEYSVRVPGSDVVVSMRLRQDANSVFFEYRFGGDAWVPAVVATDPTPDALFELLRQALGAEYRQDESLYTNVSRLVALHQGRDERQKKELAALNRQLTDIRSAFGVTYKKELKLADQVRAVIGNPESYALQYHRHKVDELKQQVVDLKAAVRVLEDSLVERVGADVKRIEELQEFVAEQEAAHRDLRERLQAECRVSKMHVDVRNATREALGCTPAEQEDATAKAFMAQREAMLRDHQALEETRAVLHCTPYDNTANKATAIMRAVKAVVRLINNAALKRAVVEGSEPVPGISPTERAEMVRTAAPLLKLFEGED